MLHVCAELDIIEIPQGKIRRQPCFPRIPGGFEIAAFLPDERREPRHLVRVGVAAHEAEASDGAAVLFEPDGEDVFIQRFACVFLQMRAVATRTTVGTARNIDCQRHLAGDFLKNDIKADVPKHNAVAQPPPALVVKNC